MMFDVSFPHNIVTLGEFGFVFVSPHLTLCASYRFSLVLFVWSQNPVEINILGMTVHPDGSRLGFVGLHP